MSDSFTAKVKILDIEAGRPIVILNQNDASKSSIFLNDRVELSRGDKDIRAIVDLSDSVEEGTVVLFEEAKKELGVEEGDEVDIEPTIKPESVGYIKKKIEGKELSEREVRSIIEDSVNFLLTDPELMAYTVAVGMSEFSMEEAEYLTRGMVETGDQIDIENAFDKHCIGGVPGNRTTPLIVPVVAAAGYRMPKTSSRAISSPAGTADVMDVLCDVEHPAAGIKELVDRTNACMTWGGALNLAPADDKFIRVRKSLSLDPMEQVLSSVLAKKKSVGSDTVLIDIPIGEEAKVKEKEEANELERCFQELGEKLGMKVVTMISDGSQPIGSGIGPALEAIDVLTILESCGKKGPEDLKEKSLRMADILLKEAGADRSAKEILESGDAYEKMKEIVKAQGGNVFSKDQVEYAEYKRTIKSDRRARVTDIHNHLLTSIAKIAGCPREKKSGVYLHKKVGDPVDEGDPLFTIYSESERRLEKAVEKAENNEVYEFKSLLE